VALRRLPESVEIDVEDTGCGSRRNIFRTIFERFYRVPTQETCTNPERAWGWD